MAQETWSKPKKIALGFFFLIGFYILTLIGSHYLLELIGNAFNGNSFQYLNTLILRNRLKDPSVRDLQYYQQLAHDLVLRVQILASLMLILILVLRVRIKVIKEEILHPKHGINIAVLRIATYSACLFFSNTLVIQTAQLPATAQIPPLGWNWFCHFFPNENLALGLLVTFKTLCVLGLMGLGGRIVHVLASITGLFLMAIPQLYGKIDHYHHIWLALTALIFTYPNEYLSIDMKLKKLEPKKFHPSYAHTLNFIILLIGVIYFFPGLWKFLLSGLEWASAGNMSAKLHNSWIEKDFIPIFRVDQYPSLVTLGGYATLIFELLFIFFAFDPLLKWPFIILAASFHVNTFFFMNIAFFDLLLLFVVFFRWEKVIKVDVGDEQQIKKPLNIFGSIVLGAFVLCGLSLIDTWPFAAYPSFASKEKNEITTVTLKYINPNGEQSLSLEHSDKLLQYFHDHARLKSYLNRFAFETNPERLDRFSTSILQMVDPHRSFQNVKFYTDRLSSIPEDQGRLIERKLLLAKKE